MARHVVVGREKGRRWCNVGRVLGLGRVRCSAGLTSKLSLWPGPTWPRCRAMPATTLEFGLTGLYCICHVSESFYTSSEYATCGVIGFAKTGKRNFKRGLVTVKECETTLNYCKTPNKAQQRD